MPSIVLDHVTKRFGDHVAVDDVSLTFPDGSFSCIVGGSGSGKTTTLKLINRLHDPDGGRVRVGGEDIAGIDVIAHRRRVGWAIQRGGLLPHRSVGDNVAIVPRLLGWPPDRIAETVDRLLDRVGLPPDRFRARAPGALSGGEQQRVGVARALAGEPDILLLDEPFGALDAEIRVKLQDDVRSLHERFGLTTVMVTHDMVAALRLADQVAVMAHGRLRQVDAPRALWNAPADDAVASLLAPARAHADWLRDLAGP